MTHDELLGKTFRPELGGPPMTVVAEDDLFVYVKRADSSKGQLANPANGYPVARSEFASWVPWSARRKANG